MNEQSAVLGAGFGDWERSFEPLLWAPCEFFTY